MSRPRRIPHYPYVGVQRYFITACTYERAKYFTTSAAVDVVVDAFVQEAKVHAVTMVVWCAMPDHVHLLLDGDHEGADAEAFMKRAKQRAGFRFKQRSGRRLWQEGYFDHVLRDEDRTEDVAFYIIANPIRKRLVENVLDYPYWGSMRYTREELLHSIGVGRRRT